MMETQSLYIGEGTVLRGAVALDAEGRDFMIRRDSLMKFTKSEGGEMTFEHDGGFYFVKARDVSGFKNYENTTEILPEGNDLSKGSNLPNVEAKAHDKGEKLTESSGLEFAYKSMMEKSLGKKREEMPQFDVETLPDVLVHFSKTVKVSKIKKKLNSLKPTQDEINEDKILGRIKSKSTNWKDRQYIISLDGYILDGHHDWAHGLDVSPEEEVNCWRISLPIKILLARANRLKIAKKVDIDGNEISKGKHIEMVTVHGKNKTFQRRQMVGHEDKPNITKVQNKTAEETSGKSKRISLKPKVEHAKRARTPQ